MKCLVTYAIIYNFCILAAILNYDIAHHRRCFHTVIQVEWDSDAIAEIHFIQNKFCDYHPQFFIFRRPSWIM